MRWVPLPGRLPYLQAPSRHPGAFLHGRQSDPPLSVPAVHHRLGIKTSAIILDSEGNISVSFFNPDRYVGRLSMSPDIGQGLLKYPVDIGLG